MPTTHKDLCDKAKQISTAFLSNEIGTGDFHEQIIELFDGPQQREADAQSPLTLQDLQTLIGRTLPLPCFQHWFEVAIRPGATESLTAIADAHARRIDLLHAILGVCGEAGEMLDPVKKSMFYGKPLDVDNIKEEAGDLLWYIGGPLCRALGCTLEELARANVAKLQKRYPEKYTDQAAIDRADKN